MFDEKTDKTDGDLKYVSTATQRISKLNRKILGTGYERLKSYEREFRSAWEANQRNWEQMWVAKKMMFAAPGEQWDQEVYNKKSAMGLRCAQYNIIGPKVHTATGAILADQYDFKYLPIDLNNNSCTKAIEDSYYDDKNICGFEAVYQQVIQDGVIHAGDMEIVVDNKYDPRGNIRFRRVMPGRLVWDPYWINDDTGESANIAFKWGVFDLPTIFRMNGDLPNTPEVSAAIQRIQQSGMSWEKWKSQQKTIPEVHQPDLYMVIERFWMEDVKTERLFGLTQDGKWLPFPITKDESQLDMFAYKHGITDWTDGVKKMPYTDRICHMAVLCPELVGTNIIKEGKPEVQVQSLPFIHFTIERDMEGNDKGLVQDQIDAQKDFNYTRSKRSEYLASGLGGANIVDASMMPSDQDRKDFSKNHNDPTRTFWVEGQPKAFLQKMYSSQPPADLLNFNNDSITIDDKISRVPAAMSAEQKGANEPSSLYAMKLKVSRLGQWTMDQRVKNVRKRMAEMYYKQAQISYAGPTRVFKGPNGKRRALNEKVERDGKAMIRNNVKYAPRVTVEVSESPQNLTRQERERTELAAVIESIPQQYKETLTQLFGQIIGTTNIGIEHKAELQSTLQMEKVKARLNSILEIKSMVMQIKQSEVVTLQTQQQLDQLIQQLEQQTAAAGQMQAIEQGEDTEEFLTPVEEQGQGQSQQPTQQPGSGGEMQDTAGQLSPSRQEQESFKPESMPAGLGI
ncbi:MAG: hypothetical protein ACOC4Y_01240 [bacterium]